MASAGKFAKLFERDGEQVLVMKDTNDDGAPCVSFTCDLGELMAIPKISFKKSDKGFDERDRVFNECDEDKAFAMRQNMETEFGHMLQDGAQDGTASARKPPPRC